MSEQKTYVGSCHCGKVRYEAQANLEQPLVSCNCSMCGRNGALMTFVPAEQFKLLSGEDVLTDYLFNKKQIHHLFCSECGIRSFARGVGRDGSAMFMLNVRCLEGVDPSSFQVTHYDGRSK